MTTRAAFLCLAALAHAGLPLLATPAAPIGAALLLLATPAAVAAGIHATRPTSTATATRHDR